MCRLVLLGLVLALVLGLMAPAFAAPPLSVADRLAVAKKAGKPVFLLVTEPRARDVAAVRATLVAAQRQAPHVAIVEMDRTQSVNKAIVKRYGVAGARAPFTLVVAHNGAPGGGVMPGPKAQEQLLALLPSPRKADTLLALFQRKAAFVIIGRPKMASRAAALAACRKAVGKLKGKATVIEVGLDDEAEKTFLKVLGADARAKDCVVHVYGLSGRKTEVLKGAATTEALLKAAKKKSECCPGGKCG